MTEVRPQPCEAIRRMTPYSPPTSGRQGQARHDFNENTVGCSPRVVERLREIATADFLATYPEYEGARAKFAEFYGVGANQVLISDGTDEAILVLLNTFCEPGDEVLMPWPTFPMYRFYAEIVGAMPIRVSYREPDLAFPIEELIAGITPKARAILIASPNNPTGGGIGLDTVEQILNAAPGAAVLIDEAYFEFFGVTAIELIPKYPNLFVSRTFSKTYGLAALRVGCMLSQSENVAAMLKGQSPYSVTSVGIACALAAIEDQDYIRSYVEEVLEARAGLIAALDELRIAHYATDANFVLAQFGDRAESTYEALKAKGILLRPRGKEIPGTIRITVGTKAQTASVIDALREAM